MGSAEKHTQRNYFKKQIQNLSLNWKQLSQQISDNLCQWSIWKTIHIVSAYRALKGEISLEVFIQKQLHLRFVFPNTPVGDNPMVFYFEDQTPCPVSDIDLFLVPGLAFDRMGRRLGRGGGHYDRALVTARGWKVGLALSPQIAKEDLPEEQHDIRMDAIGTENFIFFPLKHSAFFKGVY